MLDLLLIAIVAFVAVFVSVWFLLTFVDDRKNVIKRSKVKKKPKISIIIPAYNEEKNISALLKNILKINYDRKKLEIIVVDDGSTDNTYHLAKKFSRFGIKVYKKENGGKGSALNFGLKKCSNDLIMAMDADTVLTKDSLINIIKYLDSPSTMSVIPNIRVYKPSNHLEKVQDVGYALTNFIRKILALSNSLNIANASPIFKKTFFKKYGGFDEKNITEDFEIGLRIQSKNYNVEHAFDSIVYTKVPKTFKSLMKQRIRWYYGLFYNLKKYRFMFGSKYGDIGTFLLPITVIGFAIGMSVIFYMLMQISINLFDFFNTLILIDFDIAYFLKFDLDILSNRVMNLQSFLFVVSLITAITMITITKKVSKVNVNLVWYAIYMFLYGWMFTIFELIGFTYFLLGKRPKW